MTETAAIDPSLEVRVAEPVEVADADGFTSVTASEPVHLAPHRHATDQDARQEAFWPDR